MRVIGVDSSPRDARRLPPPRRAGRRRRAARPAARRAAGPAGRRAGARSSPARSARSCTSHDDDRACGRSAPRASCSSPAGGWSSTSSRPSASDIADTHGRWLEREPGIFERADWDSQARTLTLSVGARARDDALAWLSRRVASCSEAGSRSRLLRLVRPHAHRGGEDMIFVARRAWPAGSDPATACVSTAPEPAVTPPAGADSRVVGVDRVRAGSLEQLDRVADGDLAATRRPAPASRACPASSARSPSRSSSMRWQGSQTIVISKTASSPTRTRWPIGHCSTSVPSTVRFSRIAPGSTPTESRCSFETNSTSRFGGFACAQPSRPSPGDRQPALVRRPRRPLLRPGDVQTPTILGHRLDPSQRRRSPLVERDRSRPPPR